MALVFDKEEEMRKTKMYQIAEPMIEDVRGFNKP